MTILEYLDKKTSKELSKISTIKADIREDRYKTVVENGKTKKKIKYITWYDPWRLDYLKQENCLVMRFLLDEIADEVEHYTEINLFSGEYLEKDFIILGNKGELWCEINRVKYVEEIDDKDKSREVRYFTIFRSLSLEG